MTMSLYLLIAALFLPLFPLSMLFNEVFARLKAPWQRVVLLLVWPQIGVWALTQAQQPVPDWLIGWALASAVFYAYRALALREVGMWVGFLAVSAWPLLWIGKADFALFHQIALGMSLPLAMMSALGGVVENRFGAAHTALDLRLASATPRLAGLFVAGILAAVATPVFPNFFVLLSAVAGQATVAPLVAGAILLVWLLWSWSGARLLQDIVVGPERAVAVDDLSAGVAWIFVAGFIILAIVGILLGGVLL